MQFSLSACLRLADAFVSPSWSSRRITPLHLNNIHYIINEKALLSYILHAGHRLAKKDRDSRTNQVNREHLPDNVGSDAAADRGDHISQTKGPSSTHAKVARLSLLQVHAEIVIQPNGRVNEARGPHKQRLAQHESQHEPLANHPLR